MGISNTNNRPPSNEINGRWTSLINSGKLEPLLFWILVLLGTLPVLLSKYYLTLDGPSHLYNGYIIKELVLGNYQEFSNLFTFNPLMVPNCISHFLFAILGLVFPDFITEKIVFLGYFILTPLFFRKICLQLAPENKFLSYLMIPFSHHHLFYFGFFNFSIALTLFFIIVNFGLKIQTRFQIKHIWKMALLLIIVYFSHVMILLISIVVLFLLPLNVLSLKRKDTHLEITGSGDFWKNIKYTAWAVIPALLLTVNYILRIDSLEQAPRMDLLPLLKMIIDVRPLMTLAYGFPWKSYNWLLMSFFLILIIGNIQYTLRKNFKKRSDGFSFNMPAFRFSLVWFLIALAFTILFLIVPNSNLLPERLILILFIFFILGIATLQYPRKLRIISLFFILMIQIVYVKMHINEMRNLSNQVVKIKETTEHIEPGSLLITFNYSDNWFNSHIAGYFGSGKPIVVLENYEGQLNWFPVQWNIDGPYELGQINLWGVENKKIVGRFYSNLQDPDIFSLPQKDGKIKDIPYAVIFGKMPTDTDPDFQSIKTILDKSYSLIFQNEFCWLYRLVKQAG